MSAQVLKCFFADVGFWSVLMQALFSFSGSEVPGIAAGEIVDAKRNVPRALRRVWLRIVLFYICGILCVGLLVPQSNPGLQRNDGTGYSSPFVIAIQMAGVRVLPSIVNAAFLLSAWSAACSDLYISSRFLFFLARCEHAPKFFARLIRPPYQNADDSDDSDEEDESRDSYDLSTLDDNSARRGMSRLDLARPLGRVMSGVHDLSFAQEHDIPPCRTQVIALPIVAVLFSSLGGLFSFLSLKADGSAAVVFGWLTSASSVAWLQSWICLFFTYIRWYKGTVYAERDCVYRDILEARRIQAQISEIKVNRHPAQPYIAYYGFTVCLIVLITNGWAVFVHNGWRLAEIAGEELPVVPSDWREANPVSLFLSSYVPLPLFLLLTFGYKLIHQTEMVPYSAMKFERHDVPTFEEREEQPRSLWARILAVVI